MPSPQPKWIVVGGCCLAFMSAAVNVGFLVRLGASVSHLTGDVSKATGDLLDIRHGVSSMWINLITAAIGFVAGAAASGYFIHHPALEIARPYGRSVVTIGLCLLAAHFALETRPVVAIGLASFACGLQNALATHYRGMVLRTTHVTGLLTDLGTFLGMRLKGHQVPLWKIAIPGPIVLSFIAGSAFGASLVISNDLPFLLVLAPLYITGGIGWSLAKRLVASR